MADLRSAVVWLTHSGTSWSVDEAATLAGATVSRTRAYLTHLARISVLARVGDRFSAGPKASDFRKQATGKSGDTYGNSAAYQQKKRIREDIRSRAWKEGRAAHASPLLVLSLTSQDVAEPSMTSREASEATMDIGRTLKEAGKILGCSDFTVRRMISRGEIQAYSIGLRGLRVTSAELERYMTRNLVPSGKTDARIGHPLPSLARGTGENA